MTKDNDKEINEQDLDNISGGRKVDIKKFINVGVTIELDDAQLKGVTGGRGPDVEKYPQLIKKEKEKEETPAVETETTDNNPHDNLLPDKKPSKYGPR